ncbi:ATP-binding protein [Thiohalophilus sp.]|uniref:ATP-binding protein n=1 Tax=Thiohalophilus sp. TaxID=3028392 RepID=UPI002ACDA954|nr:ATP-binding protein [Thiohalophilus sp.]MDZ7802954.1 ATP-binding protein [Thiohalophilus sp.]
MMKLYKWAASADWPDPADPTILTRERGQAIVRIAISVIFLVYLTGMVYPIKLEQVIPVWIPYLTGFVVFSLVVAWQIKRSSRSPGIRRLTTNIADIGTVSFLMITNGESGIPLFVLYLWITLGNGFRFGVPPLIVSTVLSVIGFSFVIGLSPTWQAHPPLIGGVMLAIIVLPLYTGHLIRQLNAAHAKVKEASNAKSEFLARMSHELRTPLNGILGSSEMLRDSPRLSPEERSLLDVIDDSVNASLRQINNVLDFSRLESGKLALEQTDLDLHQLLNTTTSIIQPAISKKRLRFLLRIAPDVPYHLRGDAHHLRQIIFNLLANAVRFTEEGSVRLDVRLKEQLGSTARLRFEVQDTGIGIAPEAMDKIFDSFAQEDTSTTRRYGGTGLGTTIAKTLVELMGGEIGATSIKHEGSTFWFELPFTVVADAEDESMLSDQAKVLLVSRDAQLVSAYQQILGERVVHSESLAESTDFVMRALRIGNPYHAILVDQAIVREQEEKALCEELVKQSITGKALMVLVSDQPHVAPSLSEWDYNTMLPRNPTKQQVRSVLHAAPRRFITEDANSKLTNVPSWLWGQRNNTGNRTRILIADDNRTNLMITRRILDKAGFDVETVETGDAALEKLHAGGYRLAILDMHMPGLDGTEVLRQYRMMRPKSSLPVIVLTANASFSAQQACAEVNANAYLAKPVTAQQLLDEVQRLLEETQVEILPWCKPQSDAAGNSSGSEQGETQAEIDIAVLAELDRLCSSPGELTLMTEEYEREGSEILQRIANACRAQNHPAFCDEVHALKSNATNVGARNLMQACSVAGAVDFVDFKRNHTRLLAQLQDAYITSLSALRQIAGGSPQRDQDKSA